MDKILSPLDLQNLTVEDLVKISAEIRQKIIQTLSINGGHLASNLGVVELTIALHKVFASPKDKLIFDTGHQCYTHKILTGRNGSFHKIRQFHGIAGFPSPEESPHDIFYTGHAGTSLSLALGLTKRDEFSKNGEHIIPIIGDTTLTCGLTLEALNNIPKNLPRFIVVLNDNKMAISQSVGNIKNILSRLLSNPTSNKIYLEIQNFLSKIPNLGELIARQGQKITESLKNLVSPAVFFEQFGLSYVGPIPGHDLKKLIDTFSALKNTPYPVIVHVLTNKGQGMEIAEKNPTTYHGAKPFDLKSGLFFPSNNLPNFSSIFGKWMVETAEKDEALYAISPAMIEGSGLSEFRDKFPKRCIDVGIAEGHAVTLAAGMAYDNSLRIVVAIYSTFLQRAFDSLFHDVCLQNLPVIFAVDRAGLSGPDGATHHGLFDLSFLSAMPNMVIAAPRNGTVLKELLMSAFSYKKPMAIRYPNLPVYENLEPQKRRALGEAEVLSHGQDILIIALGHTYKTALEVKEILKSATVVDPVFVKPLDETLFKELLATHSIVITIEEHAVNSGFGSIFNTFLLKNGFTNIRVMNFGIPDQFIEQGSNRELLLELELDAKSIASKIIKNLNKTYDYSTVSK